MPQPSPVLLPSRFDAVSAAEVREQLLEAIACGGGVLDVDASAVDSIDTPAFQTLLAADRELAPAGRRLRMTGARAHVGAAAELLGLARVYFQWTEGAP
jgi:anti-anti-sigma regulatory factor